jgi:hypothetical protein
MAFGVSPRSSAVEHFLGKGEVTGSSPVAGSRLCQKFVWLMMSSNQFLINLKKECRSVAPTVEQQTPNLRVGGSNPSWPAKLLRFLTKTDL